MIDFDEVALKLAKAEADNKVLKNKLDRYEKALEKIATDRKIISMTGYSFDNEIYVNAAREALGLPFDIPEYDNVD